MTAADELRQRWTPARADEARRALGARWNRRKKLAQAAFGVVEGRLDFRGLTIVTNLSGAGSAHVSASGVDLDYGFVTLDGPPEFHGATWTSIDFSNADIDHLRLFSTDLRDCLFVGATLRDWRNWGVHFAECDFSGADLENANVGGAPYEGRYVEYANCLWRRGRLESVVLSDGLYRDCRFEDVTLRDQQVRNARFIGCTFSGRLEDIRFDGRDTPSGSTAPWDVRPDAMVDCDLTACELDGVEFDGIDIRGIVLPPKGERVHHISRVARNAYRWAETADIDSNDRRFLQMYWRGHLTNLSDDAEGWLDLDLFQERARTLVQRSMAGGA